MIKVKSIYHLCSKTIIYVYKNKNKHPRSCAGENLVEYFKTHLKVLYFWIQLLNLNHPFTKKKHIAKLETLESTLHVLTHRRRCCPLHMLIPSYYTKIINATLIVYQQQKNLSCQKQINNALWNSLTKNKENRKIKKTDDFVYE